MYRTNTAFYFRKMMEPTAPCDFMVGKRIFFPLEDGITYFLRKGMKIANSILQMAQYQHEQTPYFFPGPEIDDRTVEINA